MKSRREVFLLEETGKEQYRNKMTGMKMLVCALLMSGFWLAFYAFFYTLPYHWLILLAGTGASVLLVFCQNRRPWSVASLAGVTGLIVLLLLVNLTRFFQSFIYALNQIITVWNHQFDKYYTLFALSDSTETGRLLFWITISLAGALLLSRLVKGEYRIALTMLTMGMIFLSVVLNVGLGIWGALLMAMGWFLFWIMNVIQRQSVMKILQVIGILTVCCLVVGIATRGYQGIQSVTDLKENIVDGAQRIRYGEDTLPQGELSKAYELVGDDSEALILNFEQAQEMYLRGYVGADFQGNRWSEASGEIYAQGDASGMLDWLKEQGLESAYQYAEYQKAADPVKKADNEVTVENVGAYSKYIYAPYEIDGSAGRVGKQIYDWQLQSTGLFGSKNYSYQLMDTNLPSELIVAQPIAEQTEAQKNYINAENVYRTFVYQNYLTVNAEEEEEAFINEAIYNNQSWDNANIYQLTSQIRISLQGLVSYSDTPPEYKGDEEFVSWFLTKAKSGNSSYYATIATLAYRAMGVPARYVEGYYLTDGAATKLNGDNETSTVLTHKDAHAWTEVYMDEIGWMPVEVVPGFYFADYTTQAILDIPQSSVSIQDEDNQDELEGSTTDQLEPVHKETKPEETVARKTIRVLGIVLLILMILVAVYLLLQLQKMLRMQRFEKKINKGDHAQVGSLLYDRACLIFYLDQVPGDEWFPYENVAGIAQRYEGISGADYTRFVSLIQKEIFGNVNLRENEIYTLKAFIERLTAASYKSANIWKRFKMKYVYCVCD